MGSSRENSPDWLRSFQAPTLTLSSPSNSSSPTNTEDFPKNNYQNEDTGSESKTQKKKQVTDRQAVNRSVWAISSDSDSDDTTIATALRKGQVKFEAKDGDAVLVGSSEVCPSKEAGKKKSPKKKAKDETRTPTKEKTLDDDVKRKEIAEEDTSEKHNVSYVSTSRLPLVLPEKVQRSKALVECEGDSIDLSGDMGAVGRIVIPDSDTEMYLDLKGTIYKTTILPSRTFCVVNFGQSEAKIEAIMNDFIQLKAQSNVFEAETMVEGTLEGFTFDSDDEADKIPKAMCRQSDQNDGVDEQTNGKNKRKAVKSSGIPRKKGTAAGRKAQPANKSRKKTQTSKKTKNKK